MIPAKAGSIVTVSEGPSGVFILNLLSEDIDNLPGIEDGVLTGSVAYVQDAKQRLLYHEDNGWAEWS